MRSLSRQARAVRQRPMASRLAYRRQEVAGQFGNQAMLRRLSTSSPRPQAMLVIAPVNNRLEREADHLANHAMRMPDLAPVFTRGPAQLSRKCVACDDAKVQTRRSGAEAVGGEAPTAVHEALNAPGRPLDATTRAFFEPRFGADLSEVQVHDDHRAANSARQVGARAYAVGSHLVFGAGEYAPSVPAGQKLIAHELAHVLQQGMGDAGKIRRDPAPPGSDPAPVPPAPAPSPAPTPAPAPGATPACAEQPTFNSTSKPPTTMDADSVVEFLAKAKAQIGDPFTKPTESHSMDLDDKGSVTKVNMTVEIQTSRPRLGVGRPSEKEKALILKAVDLIKDHEDHHQAIAKQMHSLAVCRALGKKGPDANEAIDHTLCKFMAWAQEDYDLQHGELVVVKDATGTPSDVITGPVATRPNYGC